MPRDIPREEWGLPQCFHDPFTTYTIPPEDKEVIVKALQLLSDAKPHYTEEDQDRAYEILKYLS